MEKGLNFRTEQGQADYFKAYEKTLKLWEVNYTETYIETSYGKSHCLICGDKSKDSIVLLHAASCGATIWYPNIKALSENHAVYAIDLITEASKSILLSKVKTPEQCAAWLSETLQGLNLTKIILVGLSIGGWNAINFAVTYPDQVNKLVLLSPIQTFIKMYPSFLIKILKMGFRPTRKSIEQYLGWGNKKEAPLPDSVIEQFTISALNINSNGAFPKMINRKKLSRLTMPVMVLFGENEYAFDVKKAIKIVGTEIDHLVADVIKEASHLINVSSPDTVNMKMLHFIED